MHSGAEALQSFFRPGRYSMTTEESFLMSRDARSVAQTKAAKARFTGPPAFPGRATASPADSFSRDTNHETRITAFMLPYPRFPTISRHFPAFPAPPPPPGQGSARRSHRQHDRLGFHDTRDTNHELCRRPVAAFLRVVVRHGAAMARHGRPPSPAPATRPVGFSPATRHATWFFPVPPATPRRATPSPTNGFSRNTNHESRNTNHGFYDDE